MAWRVSVELIMLLIQRRSPCLAVFSGLLVSVLLRAVCFASMCMCVNVYVSGFFCVWNPFSRAHTVVLLQINVCREALVQISLNLPSPGEGKWRASVGFLGRGGQAPPSHLGAQTLDTPSSSRLAKGDKGWAPRL